MLNPKEFRIGNLIYREFSRDNKELSTITGYDFLHSEKLNEPNHLVEWKSLSPVPISNDILVEYGFEKVDHIGGYSFWLLKRDKVSIYIYDTRTELNGKWVKHIKYFNEIQNLYFSASGEELVKTEPKPNKL